MRDLQKRINVWLLHISWCFFSMIFCWFFDLTCNMQSSSSCFPSYSATTKILNLIKYMSRRHIWPVWDLQRFSLKNKQMHSIQEMVDNRERICFACWKPLPWKRFLLLRRHKRLFFLIILLHLSKPIELGTGTKTWSSLLMLDIDGIFFLIFS